MLIEVKVGVKMDKLNHLEGKYSKEEIKELNRMLSVVKPKSRLIMQVICYLIYLLIPLLLGVFIYVKGYTLLACIYAVLITFIVCVLTKYVILEDIRMYKELSKVIDVEKWLANK